MIKTYKANTNISINVVLQSKKNLHVSFVPLSNGSSVFTTDREEVQNAIESHYKFSKLFVLASTQGIPNKGTVKKTVEKANTTKEDDTQKNITKENANVSEEANEANADNNDDVDTEETENDENAEVGAELKKVTVSDIATAKDYLADSCGVSRTAMRSTKSILEHALANGIEFVGI